MNKQTVKLLTAEYSLPESIISLDSSPNKHASNNNVGDDFHDDNIDKFSEGLPSSKSDAAKTVSSTGPVKKKTIDVNGLKRRCFMIRPYLGLIYQICLLIVFLGLVCLACCWFCFFHTVQFTMTRTFAWEFIIQLLGSQYDDCIDRSQTGFPIETAPRKQCSYIVTTPWIPLVGFGICILTCATVAFLCFYRWTKMKIRLSASTWKIGLVFLGMTECLHFGFGFANLYQNTAASQELREHMQFTMMNSNSEKLLHDIYFRWKITQAGSKCCGVEGPLDWNLPIFENGHRQFPISCCDTDKYNSLSSNQCKFFPTRAEIWKQGCYEVEMETVKEFQHQFAFLLISSLAAIMLVTILTWLLEKFLETQPLIPAGTKFTCPTFFRKPLSFKLPFSSKPPGHPVNPPQDNLIFKPDPAAKPMENAKVDPGNKKENSGSCYVTCAADYLDVDHVGAIKTKLVSSSNSNNHPNNDQRSEDKSCKGHWEEIDMKPIFTRKFQTSSNASSEMTTKKPKKKMETMV